MTNAEGMTALHLSTIKDQHQIVRLLLKNGGDKSIKDNNHKTPMDYATEMVCSMHCMMSPQISLFSY